MNATPARFLSPNKGRGREIQEMLRKELGVPEHCRSFSVHFEAGNVVYVKCEYMPRVDDDSQD